MSRAVSLSILAAAVCLALTAPGGVASPRGERELLILSTASNRGEVDHCGCHKAEKGGLTRRMAYVDSMRSREPLLLVDAGDYCQPALTQGEQENWFILRAMGRMGYDAMTLGEIELGRGAEYVQAILDSTRVPVTLANVSFTRSGKPVGEKFILARVGDVTYAIVGLIGPDFGEREAKLSDLGFTVEDPVVVAKRLVPELEAKADVVLVLAHLGAADAAELPKSVPGIDAVILGHYPGTDELKQVEGAVVIRPGQRGQYVAETRITLTSQNKVASFSGTAVAMDKKVIREDPQMLADLRGLMHALGRELRDDA
jgi:2',3'-cyclic-nucleotide 2'-phosphodiesterase (5'-nucleotidase family)